jgi:hypothetical protein
VTKADGWVRAAAISEGAPPPFVEGGKRVVPSDFRQYELTITPGGGA